MLRLLLIMSGALLSLGAANPKPSEVERARRMAAAKAEVAAFISPTLTRFASEEEFLRYAAAVSTAGGRLSAAQPSKMVKFAWAAQAGQAVQSDATPPPCPENLPECHEVVADSDDSIVVTGSRVNVVNPSITNNQMKGVEEGDIIKQINNHLLILQNGRIYVVDIRANKAGKLALADRMNVYLTPRDDSWYDEMLVFGDRVLITGYSYGADATLLTVFRLSDRGKLSREGRFYLTSNDYFSSNNYATRMIGDNLVIYTPFDVNQFARQPVDWPVVRRWTADGTPALAANERRVFDARNIYRPVALVEDPTVHTVSVCPLGDDRGDRALQCRTTGFVGPAAREWYVTGDSAYLWTYEQADTDRDCAVGEKVRHQDVIPATAYRIPLDGGPIAIAAARGEPYDQFSMLATAGHFRALLRQTPNICDFSRYEEAGPAYLSAPLGAFGQTLAEIPASSYTPLPDPGSVWVANRFSDKYLVYGGMSRYRSGLPKYDPTYWGDDPDRLRYYKSHFEPKPAYVVPLDNPSALTRLDVRHTLIRVDLAGENAVVTGYRGWSGLSVSLLDLRGRPHVASTQLLDGRFESEGRSHAFNSRIEPDGSGLMGLPTVPKISRSLRYTWRSTASDVSFLTMSAKGSLKPAGELRRKFDYDDDSEGGIAGAECEVSCVDWYGNSRPVFTDGRIFALTGAELVEGRLDQGEIYEVRRINVALDSPRP